ncbi:MAG TPA: diguanylate cyclase, partial [Rhodocyclaceae bacterium]|nr:diguanylate cyclase [Rhodocyclaceae bacterium]
ALTAARTALLAGQRTDLGVELRMRNKHDAFVWVQILGRASAGGTLPATRITGTYLDISQRKQDEARLSEQQEHLRTLIRSIPDIVLDFDTANVITGMHVPEAQQDWLPKTDYVGRPYHDLLPAELVAALDAGMLACFDDASPHTFECQIKRGEDSRYFSATVSRLADHGTWPNGFLAVIRDVTEVRKAEQELRQMAFHDPLTGLANRRLLEDRLHQATLFSAREQSWAAVIVLDLDRFKPLNDTYGHETGDRLLVELASRLRDAVREIDTVARLGGDEFVVVL